MIFSLSESPLKFKSFGRMSRKMFSPLILKKIPKIHNFGPKGSLKIKHKKPRFFIDKFFKKLKKKIL